MPGQIAGAEIAIGLAGKILPVRIDAEAGVDRGVFRVARTRPRGDLGRGAAKQIRIQPQRPVLLGWDRISS